MDMTYKEIRAITVKEFNYRLAGYVKRQENEWDRTRNQMSYIASFAMGMTKFVRPQDVMKLNRDYVQQPSQIRNLHQAEILLNQF